MAIVNIDLSNPEELERKPLVPAEPGTYVLSIAKDPDLKSTAKGGQMLVFEFVIEDDGPEKGKHIFHNAVLMEKMRWQLYAIAKCFGVPIEGEGANGKIDFGGRLGYKGRASVGQEVAKDKAGNVKPGEFRNTVRQFLYEK